LTVKHLEEISSANGNSPGRQMSGKIDKTDERANRWQRRQVKQMRAKTDEREDRWNRWEGWQMRKERAYYERKARWERKGQQRIRQSDKRTERNRRNSALELIIGRSFEGGEESKRIK
jgi:hypothetical protein